MQTDCKNQRFVGSVGSGEICDKGGVIAEPVAAAGMIRMGRPDVAYRAQGRSQGGVDENLVETEAVLPMGIPGIVSRLGVECAEAIAPVCGGEIGKPLIGAADKDGAFLVYADFAGIGVADEQSGAGSPTLGEGEDAGMIALFAAGVLVGDVHGADGDAVVGFAGHEPAAGLVGFLAERDAFERGAGGDE